MFNWNWHHIRLTTAEATIVRGSIFLPTYSPQGGYSYVFAFSHSHSSTTNFITLTMPYASRQRLSILLDYWGCSPCEHSLHSLHSQILLYVRTSSEYNIYEISQICDGHEIAKFIAVNLYKEFLASFVYIKCIWWTKRVTIESLHDCRYNLRIRLMRKILDGD